MSENKTDFAETKAKVFIDTLIQVCAVAVLMILSFKVLSPFLPLILWGILLAIMIYPLHQRGAKRLKGTQGNSMANHLLGWWDAYQNHELFLLTPVPLVKECPVVDVPKNKVVK
jgi:predicted PurR-regulated permease PerM